MEAAAEPSLQVEGSLRAKLTGGGGQPSAGGGQALQAHAQSHQEQRFALHLQARPSVGATGRRREPQAGAVRAGQIAL